MQPNKAISENDMQLMRKATYLSVATASIIIIIKLAAWVYTGSLSLLSSLADSCLDVISSIINLTAVRYALMPADADHRFGHGKAEDIAAFAQSAFIGGSALFIVIQAINRIINKQELQNEFVGVAVMLVSTVLTIGLVTYQKYVIKKTNSSVVKADSLHYTIDIMVNLMVISSLLASMFFDINWLDIVMAFAIAAYISKGAWHVGRNAFDNLMDKEMPDVDRARIIECILQNKKVKGVHDLRTRVSGIRSFIQFHLELDGKMPLSEAHKIADEIENEVAALFPSAEVIVHQDPEEGQEEITLQMGGVVPVKKG